MNYREEVRDLFEVNSNLAAGEEPYCLAHCISADFGMFGGVVVGFNERWDMKNKLVSKYTDLQEEFLLEGSQVIPIEVLDGSVNTTVYNLVTKQLVSHLPNYQSVVKALIILKAQMQKDNKSRLAIPKIGCGIDRLEWYVVSELIKAIFSDTDVDILVCCIGD